MNEKLAQAVYNLAKQFADRRFGPGETLFDHPEQDDLFFIRMVAFEEEETITVFRVRSQEGKYPDECVQSDARKYLEDKMPTIIDFIKDQASSFDQITMVNLDVRVKDNIAGIRCHTHPEYVA